MSTALGVAAVTHVLKDLLNDGLINRNVAHIVNSNVLVSSLCPGQINGDGTPGSQLNLFLYRVSPNLGWRNRNLPSRNGRGDLIDNPALSLNLHYLLTAFGESELHGEILLGYGMQLLHENPVLDRDAIRRSLTPAVSVTGGTLPDSLLELSNSGLAEQMELIKITHEPIDTEEISRLWTAFQASYRPCTAYLATVVLIESERSTQSALPVRERRVFALPFRHPYIERFLSQANADAANPVVANRQIVVGDRLIIRGRQLKNPNVRVRINEEDLSPIDSDVSDNEIRLVLPASLKAGLQAVQVIHPLNLQMPNTLEEDSGGLDIIVHPPELRTGPASNLQGFVLSPRLTGFSNSATPAPATTGSPPLFDVDVQVTLQPALQENQRVMLLLNQVNPASGEEPRAYSAALPADILADIPAPVATVTLTVEGVIAGDFLLRVRVDGADTPLDTDADGRFTGPQITVP